MSSSANLLQDPYFETVPATRLGGLYKTTKKRRRALPPGLTAEEEKILIKAKRRAYRIDLSLGNFCGMRFGWGSVIGLIPG
jgi:integrase